MKEVKKEGSKKDDLGPVSVISCEVHQVPGPTSLLLILRKKKIIKGEIKVMKYINGLKHPKLNL